ncbi:MAG: adaptor protein MecA [Firmicutes bacterium]|nr:adaptor protein MecA [Bacillota bacterium]
MKIEKVSDSQLKFTLTQADMEEMKIKIEDLATPSERTQKIFRDMIEKAVSQCDFPIDNTPLMVEAVPASPESIMIIVTKVSNKKSENIEKFFQLDNSKGMRKYKRKSIEAPYSPRTVSDDSILILSFDTLDDIIDISPDISKVYTGTNSVYKNNGRYFLIVINDNPLDNIEVEAIEDMLYEFGRKHVSNMLAEEYLMEHGEKIIDGNALQVLADTFA